MKKMGKIVVTYGVDERFSNLITVSDVSVACNMIECDNEDHKDSYYDETPIQGKEESKQSTQISCIASKTISPLIEP